MVMAYGAYLGHFASARTAPCCKLGAVRKVPFRYCPASRAGRVEVIQLHPASLFLPQERQVGCG